MMTNIHMGIHAWRIRDVYRGAACGEAVAHVQDVVA